MSKYLSRMYNPYRRPSLKEKYEKLKEIQRIAKKHTKRASAKPVRKPAKATSGETKAQHWRKKEKTVEISNYLLPKSIRNWKRKTPKSRYKPRPRTRHSRY